MTTDFKNLPGDSRIWIYQANRKLREEEVGQIATKTKTFLEQWTAHGSDLEAGFEIRYNRFIVIGLNQENATTSGCSIDTSVNFIQHFREYRIAIYSVKLFLLMCVMENPRLRIRVKSLLLLELQI